MERSEKKLNIKIITTSPFPVGLASTNRIMTYAKGLVENGCNVTVLCMKTTEKSDNVLNENKSGEIEGVTYIYTCGKTIMSKNKIINSFNNMIGVINMCNYLINSKENLKTDAIIYYAFATKPALILYLLTRIKKIVFLKEISEFPSVYVQVMSSFRSFIFRNIHYSLFDGYLIMTKRLIKYFKDEKRIKGAILHTPMTVDFTRFNLSKESIGKKNYIAYCGILNDQKDGVNFLVDAFCQIAPEFPDINLYLIGKSASVTEYESYIKKISDAGLIDRVLFTGQVESNKIPELLSNALILVLARPNSLQAEGGFPTKLGEYLATGNPVVVTKVGEIPDYLTDEINAYLADPDDAKSIYYKIRSILMNYPKAEVIGKEGRKVALQNFNYRIQAKNIIKFIKTIQ